MKKIRNVLLTALILLMSVLTTNVCDVSAKADLEEFTDNSLVTKSEAVSIMMDLKLVSGYPDGTVQPQKTILRSELMKIICLALNGGTDPIKDENARSLFSDTDGHWANAYITYCVNLNIVSGDTGIGGTFRPDQPVTVGEAAKAILIAVGYDAEISEFVSEQWLSSIAKAANDCEPKLLDNIDFGLSEPLNREDACQMLFNGMRTSMKTYEQELAVGSDGKLGVVYRLVDYTYKSGQSDVAYTLLFKSFGYTKLTGIVVENEYASLKTPGRTQKSGYTVLDITSPKNDSGIWDMRNDTFNISTSLELLGLEVDMYVKDDNGNFTALGAPLATSKNTVLEIPEGESIYDAARAKGIQISTGESDSTVLFENYTAKTDFYSYISSYDDGNASFDLRNAKVMPGASVTVLDNDNDSSADYIFIQMPILDKVTAVNPDGSIEFYSNGGTKISQRDLITDKSILKDQIVLVTKICERYIIETPKSVKDEISRISDEGRLLTLVGGGAHYASFVENLAGLEQGMVYSRPDSGSIRKYQRLFDIDSSDGEKASVRFGQEYQFYLDKAGCIIAYTSSSPQNSIDRYILITEAGVQGTSIASNSTYEVYGYLSDGSAGNTYKVNMDSTARGAVSQLRGTELIDWNSVFRSKRSSLPQGASQTRQDNPVIARYSIDSGGIITLYDPVVVNDWRVSPPECSYTEDTVPNHYNPEFRKGQTSVRYQQSKIDGVASGGYFGSTLEGDSAIVNNKTVIFNLTRDIDSSGISAEGTGNVLRKYELSSVASGAVNMPEISESKMCSGAVLLNESGTAGAVVLITTGRTVTAGTDYVYVWSDSPASLNKDGSYTYNVIRSNSETMDITTDSKASRGFYRLESRNNAPYELRSISRNEEVGVVMDAVVQSADSGTVVLRDDGSGEQTGALAPLDSAIYGTNLVIHRIADGKLQKDGVFSNNNGAKANVSLLVNKDNVVVIAVSDINQMSSRTYTVNVSGPIQIPSLNISGEIKSRVYNAAPGTKVYFDVKFDDRPLAAPLKDSYVSFALSAEHSGITAPAVTADFSSRYALGNCIYFPEREALQYLGSDIEASFYFEMPEDNVTITHTTKPSS